MKKRQILAALLAVSCAASMAVPASATGVVDENGKLAAATDGTEMGFDELAAYSLTVNTEVQKPTLKVTLPASTGVLVNPYRIEITLDDSGATSFDTVLSPVMKVKNNSGCAINVGVKGLLQTYTIVKDFDKSAAGVVEYDLSDPETLTNDCVPAGTIDGVAKIYSSDAKNFYTEEGKQVTVKYTKPTYATKDSTDGTVHVGDKTKDGSIAVTAYTASKNIKVATAAMKDPDADKSNTLFMYVEGSTTDGEWATAFDAKKVATAASPAGMMALSAKETQANVLYLNGASGGTATEGYVRVTGQASTAPTNSWASLTDKFDADFTFVVDAVANAAPVTPTVGNITITESAGTVSTYTFAAGTKEYDITWTPVAQYDTLTFAATGVDPTDAVVTYNGGTVPTALQFTAGTGQLSAKVDPSNYASVDIDITVTATNKGKTVSYVYHVTVVGSGS